MNIGYGEVRTGTPSALLIDTKEHGSIWVPKSVITDNSEVWKEGQKGKVDIKEWWLEKKGLL